MFSIAPSHFIERSQVMGGGFSSTPYGRAPCWEMASLSTIVSGADTVMIWGFLRNAICSSSLKKKNFNLMTESPRYYFHDLQSTFFGLALKLQVASLHLGWKCCCLTHTGLSMCVSGFHPYPQLVPELFWCDLQRLHFFHLHLQYVFLPNVPSCSADGLQM